MRTAKGEIETDMGLLVLETTERGLRLATWGDEEIQGSRGHPHAEPPSEPEDSPAGRLLAQAIREIREYLARERESFDVPLDVDCGTPFQRRVWDELTRIPYGETRSYADIARSMGNDRACRAVGAANGRNPVCIIVPCHRVIAAGGALGGYTGGLGIKTRLLEIERLRTWEREPPAESVR